MSPWHIILALLLIPSMASAQAELSHQVQSRLAIETDSGRTRLWDTDWRPELRWRFDNGGRLTGSLRLRWQGEPGLRPADGFRDAYAGASRPQGLGDNAEIELRELYYERSLGEGYLTVGKQQVVWGKADGLKVLDVVDPQSFREFILEDFEQSRIPRWTLNLERPLGDWTLQVLWIPDQTYHALPKPDATFAFHSPRFVPAAPSGVAVRLNEAERPSRVFADADAGFRLSGFVGGGDLSLNYLYHYFNLPTLHQRVTLDAQPQVEITPRFHRTHLLGGTFSRAFGDWVARGEVGYFSDRYFLVADPLHQGEAARSTELSHVVGLDWSGLTDTFVSLQWFQSWLPQHDERFIRPKVDSQLTFLLRRSFLNETLRAEVLWIGGLDAGDGLVRPKLSHDLNDHLEVWLGADLFYGKHRGTFGQFDEQDRLLLGLKLGF